MAKVTSRRAFWGLPLVVLVAHAGCFGSGSTEFPEGLEPLEANTAPAPQGGTPDEALAMIDGEGHNDEVDEDYVFVHGRGALHATPGEVWAAVKDGDLLSASCRLDSWSVTPDIDAAYEYSFRVHNLVDDVVTVEWEEEWRFGTVEGTPAAPDLAMVRYQKTYGRDFIYLIEGSIQVLPSAGGDPAITEIEFIEHLAALGGSITDIRNSMQRRFDLLAAVIHGEPEPACP